MKSVIRSAKPYWIYLIITGRKKIEVGKDFPKSKDWNKIVEMYCSKDMRSFRRIPEDDREWMRKYLGKIACRFVCDRILILDNKHAVDANEYGTYNVWNADLEKWDDWNIDEACLSNSELVVYLKGGSASFWHISDLKIYDKPKELGEFFMEGECDRLDYCGHCFNFHEGQGWLDGSYCDEDSCLTFGIKPFVRPPQSWAYCIEVSK